MYISRWREVFKIYSINKARELLEEGNRRFVSGKLLTKNIDQQKRRMLAEKGQAPFAVIVGCSDSRVSPEIIFDCGLGDLFVIRTAGNIVDAVALGSIEYAVEHLQVPLVVILGHDSCGAVKGTIKGAAGGEAVSANMAAIIEEICPSLEKAKTCQDGSCTLEELVENENICCVAKKVLVSPLVARFYREGRVKVLEAKYSLLSGKVRLLFTP